MKIVDPYDEFRTPQSVDELVENVVRRLEWGSSAFWTTPTSSTPQTTDFISGSTDFSRVKTAALRKTSIFGSSSVEMILVSTHGTIHFFYCVMVWFPGFDTPRLRGLYGIRFDEDCVEK